MRTDIDISFTPHPLTGDLSVKTGVNAVEQSLKNLVLTNFYDRGFNIEIGSNVHRSLFENFTHLERQTLVDAVTQVINNFEPNVNIKDVVVEQDENELYMKIFYVAFNEDVIRTSSIPIQRIR